MFTDAMVTIEPQGGFSAAKTTALAAVEGSGNSQYLLRVNGDWTEGDTLRVIFQTPSDGANTHVAPRRLDVTLHRDTTPPVLEDPTGARLSKAEATVKVTGVEEGQLFYCVVAAEDPGPSLEQVKDCLGNAPMAVGVNTISIGALTGNNAYKAYVLAQDLEGLWGTQVTVVDIPPVYPFSIAVAADSAGRGVIENAAGLESEYPAGAVIEVEAEGETGFGVEYWDDGQAGGVFDDAYSSRTVYTMPEGPAQVVAHFAPTVIYLSATAVDGASGTATTREVKLTFASDMPGDLTPARIILPAGLTVTGVDHTGAGEYVITITGLTGQGEVPIRVRYPGVAAVPAIQTAVLYFDSTAPVLTPDGWDRTAANKGEFSFESTEAGDYWYLTDSVGEPAPDAADVVADGVPGPSMVDGPNTRALTGADLAGCGPRVVYAAGQDGEGNTSNVASWRIGGFCDLTVTAGTGGSAGPAGPAGRLEGSEVGLTATPDTGYEFAGWEVVAGGDESLLADASAAKTELTMPGAPVTVKALFAKKTLTVKFDLNVPPAAEEDVSGWTSSGTGKLGGLIGAPAAAPALEDFNFVGWYATAQAVDGAHPDEAWDFAADTIGADMIQDNATVTLHGAWASAWGEISYAIHDTDALPADPRELGPDTERIGSKLADATSYGTEVTRAGFEFDGWFLDAEYTKPVEDDTVLESTAVTLHARWLPNGDGDYAVVHYKVDSEGTAVEADREAYEGQIGTPTITATPEEYPGYEFDADESTVAGTIADGLELDLYYNAKPVQVTFDAGGGAPEPDPVDGFYDETVTAPAQPARAGFAFLGWESAEVSPWDFGADALTQANGVTGADGDSPGLELTAVWAAGPTATGDTATIGLGGTANLQGSAGADQDQGATVKTAVVTTDEDWVADAAITPGLDGTVVFEAGDLPAGDYTFEVEYTDSNGLTASAEFTVHVIAPPTVAGGTTATIKPGGTASFPMTVTSAATVEEAEVTGAPPGAEVTAETDGEVVFESSSLPGGVYKFWVTWTDSVGQPSTAKQFTVTVQAAPTGVGRNIDLADDLTQGSLKPVNDVTGTSLQPLGEDSFTQPGHGELELDEETGVLTYTPEVGWMGQAVFQVEVCDDLGQCLDLEYSFTVLSVYTPPVPPVVSGDTAVIGLGGTASLAGSVEPDQDHNATIATAEVTTDEEWVAKAVITPELDGTVEFQAGDLPAGVYEFEVRYTDSNGLSADAEFKVTVVDKPAVTGNTEARVPVGGEAEFTMTVTTGVTISSATPANVPDGASVTAKTDGKVTFEAGELEPGDYQFTVVYTDSTGQDSEPVEFTVTIQAPPTGQGRDVEVANDLTSILLDPLDDTTGHGLQALTAGSWTGPAQGSLALESGKVRYTPKTGWKGTDSFSVEVCDDLDQCVTLDYTVKVLSIYSPPEPPSASGDQANVAVGGTVTLDGDVASDIGHGTVIEDATVITAEPWIADATITPDVDGQVIFEAGTLPAGQYMFTVRYTDSNEATADAVYTVTVIAPPEVTGTASIRVAVGGTASVSLTVTSNTTIDQANTLNVPAGAQATAETDGEVSFDAGSLTPGEHTFEVAFTDDLGQDSDPFQITVTIQAAPTGAGYQFDVADDLTPADVDVFTDVTGTALKALTASSITQPAHGTVDVTDPGTIEYTPEEGWKGLDPFTVTVCDDLNQCLVLDYTANVLKVTAAPAGPPSASGATGIVAMGGTIELVGSVHGDQEHGVSISKAQVTQAGDWAAKAGITPKLDGTVWFEARTLPEGEYSFTVTFTDSNNQTAGAQFTVTVVASPLVSGDTSAKTPLGGTANLGLTVASDTIIDSTQVAGVPAGATVTAETDGKISFEAGSLPEGVYTFTVTYIDSLDQASETVPVTVTVQGPPEAAATVVREKVRLGGQVMFPESVTSKYGWIKTRVITASPDQGQAALGSVHYDAAGASPGEHPFVVEYTDDLNQTTQVTYIPLVQAPPTGSGRTVVVADDHTTVEVDVFADVTGTSLRALTAGSLTQPAHGVVVVSQSGGVRYIPEPGWKGVTSFKVQVCDDLAQCVTLEYQVSVLALTPTPPPTPPTPPATPTPTPTPGQTASDNTNGSSGSGGTDGNGGLPFTGANHATMLLYAAGWLLAGLTLTGLAAARRRRTQK
ncbi:MAG: tandem-95 repeat protein [Bifidobacteriaceae bacterium]|nr:tandem-95 repeat protein [Bifidobacteriaceae bacterium]